jgi:hypothetical protein
MSSWDAAVGACSECQLETDKRSSRRVTYGMRGQLLFRSRHIHFFSRTVKWRVAHRESEVILAECKVG